MEDQHVHSVYGEIADHFDSTRCHLWRGVVEFLEQLPAKCNILDAGCGNGKYLSVRTDCDVHACDACPALVNIAKGKHPHADVRVANVLCMPYGDEQFDYVICVAVVHHLSSVQKRRMAMEEILRVLKPGGRAFITVWATEACKPSWKAVDGGMNDYMVPWNHKQGRVFQRFYHLFTRQDIVSLVESIPTASIETVKFEKNNWQVSIKKVR